MHSLFLSLEDTIAFLRELVVPELRAARRRGELAKGIDIEQAADWIALTLSTITTMTATKAVDLDDPDAVGRFYARHVCRGLVSNTPAAKPSMH
jgi:hypothetical protein